jgi:proteasome lid subunit RPN8/RPN11
VLYRISRAALAETFGYLRDCGRGKRECVLFWTSSWESNESDITGVVHPRHGAHCGGFEIDADWLNVFWSELADRKESIRVQVHSHPGEAFHSATDDAFPVVHTPGFLSLVIPKFGLGDIGLDGAFLARLEESGRFRQVPIEDHLVIT